MRMKGVEWNAFFNDEEVWKPGIWFEGLVLSIDGREEEDVFDDLDPKASVTIESGVIYFKEDPEEKDAESFESVIRKWRKKQKFKTICVEIPNDQFSAVCDQLKKDGCKIIK